MIHVVLKTADRPLKDAYQGRAGLQRGIAIGEYLADKICLVGSFPSIVSMRMQRHECFRVWGAHCE